jgi:threonine dehydratase
MGWERVVVDLAISHEDVLDARRQLTGIVNRTPIFTSRTLNEMTGRELFLKCESFQRTGSFKFRGAYNAISRLGPAQRTAGVIAYSSGNHAQGVALSAKLLGIPAVIIMPTDAPSVKVEATRGYGAEIVFYDRQAIDGEDYQHQLAEERGMTLIHPYDHPHIMAGQGTAILELLEDVPELDTLVMPIGGGGLFAGGAVAAKGKRPSMYVLGVETEGADDTKRSFDAGERVVIPPPTTIADGIRLRTPGDLTFPIVEALCDDVLVVSDDDVRDALRFVITRMKLVIEPSGAVPVAAALRALLPASSRRVGVVVSGGNIDPLLLGALWSA